MNSSIKHVLVATGIAVVTSIGASSATVPTTADKTQFSAFDAASTTADCQRLPLNRRDFCASEGGWAAISQMQAPKEIDQRASATTATMAAACAQLPLSDRGICRAQAGYGQSVVRRTVSRTEQEAIQREDARYHAALANCKRLPLSDQATCASAAGDDRTLSGVN